MKKLSAVFVVLCLFCSVFYVVSANNQTEDVKIKKEIFKCVFDKDIEQVLSDFQIKKHLESKYRNFLLQIITKTQKGALQFPGPDSGTILTVQKTQRLPWMVLKPLVEDLYPKKERQELAKKARNMLADLILEEYLKRDLKGRRPQMSYKFNLTKTLPKKGYDPQAIELLSKVKRPKEIKTEAQLIQEAKERVVLHKGFAERGMYVKKLMDIRGQKKGWPKKKMDLEGKKNELIEEKKKIEQSFQVQQTSQTRQLSELEKKVEKLTQEKDLKESLGKIKEEIRRLKPYLQEGEFKKRLEEIEKEKEEYKENIKNIRLKEKDKTRARRKLDEVEEEEKELLKFADKNREFKKDLFEKRIEELYQEKKAKQKILEKIFAGKDVAQDLINSNKKRIEHIDREIANVDLEIKSDRITELEREEAEIAKKLGWKKREIDNKIKAMVEQFEEK